jgi:catechol 2,3-dioxygenase-like lactoylglutathione lyase family enzyme
VDLFAGVPVRDRARAIEWYTRLLGAEPSFLPNDTEAVWDLVEHGYLYVDVRPRQAGAGMVTLFVDDYVGRLAAIAERGLEPAVREVYDNGVRHATFRDPDGNEVSVGGAPEEG